MIFVPKLIGGIGNQLFILASTIDVANRLNGTVLFNRVPGNCHGYDNLNLLDLFPQYLLDQSQEPVIEYSGHDNIYCDIAEKIKTSDKCVYISGYNQHPKYIPLHFESFVNNIENPLPSLEYVNIAFIHIRRGDYVNWDLYYIDINTYLKTAVQHLLQQKSHLRFILFSDDLHWTNNNIPIILNDIVAKDNLILLDRELTPTQTLKVMSCCLAGAITANSSFSWWGAYCNKRRPIYMPWPWSGYSDTKDLGLYFDEVTVVDTKVGRILRNPIN